MDRLFKGGSVEGDDSLKQEHSRKKMIRISSTFADKQEISMASNTITEKDKQKAKKCLECPACSRARKKQKGFFYWFVKTIEGGFCPYCKAYEKVYGKKAHEPLRSM